MRSIRRYVGYALLVLALVVAPRPFGPCALTTAAMPCHDAGAISVPASHDTGPAGCDCCNDPACDPAHCVAVAPGIVAPWPDAAMIGAPQMPAAARVATPPPRPPAERLRPPIVAIS